jgi:hypothetical protein
MSKRIQFLLSDEEYEYLKGIKETQNKPFSVVIRQALEKTYDIKKPENTNKISNKKKKQLKAFKEAYGIWKDYPEIDNVIEETRERFQQWRKKIEESV